jgi:hypothetical protein
MATMWANDLLLDNLLISADGDHVGMVDDLELSDGGTGNPELTAFLTGPRALGARLGGRIGAAFIAVGRRLAPDQDPYPERLPLEHVDAIEENAIGLRIDAAAAPTRRARGWVRAHIIGRLPGNGS